MWFLQFLGESRLASRVQCAAATCCSAQHGWFDRSLCRPSMALVGTSPRRHARSRHHGALAVHGGKRPARAVASVTCTNGDTSTLDASRSSCQPGSYWVVPAVIPTKEFVATPGSAPLFFFRADLHRAWYPSIFGIHIGRDCGSDTSDAGDASWRQLF